MSLRTSEKAHGLGSVGLSFLFVTAACGRGYGVDWRSMLPQVGQAARVWSVLKSPEPPFRVGCRG
jgi:hypothetical protein